MDSIIFLSTQQNFFPYGRTNNYQTHQKCDESKIIPRKVG